MSALDAPKIIGKVYKITSPHTTAFYIGSTFTSLGIRLSQHKSACKQFQKKAGKYVSSFSIIEKGDPQITLIETLNEGSTKLELRIREQFHIDANETLVVNKNAAFQSEEDKQSHDAAFYEMNYKKIKERQKKCQQKFALLHPGYQKKYQHQQYMKNRSTCGCGKEVSSKRRAEHELTNFHQKWMSERIIIDSDIDE